VLDIPAHLWIVCFQTAMHPLVLIRSSIGLGGLKRWRDEHRHIVAMSPKIPTYKRSKQQHARPVDRTLGSNSHEVRLTPANLVYKSPQQRRTIYRISLCTPNLELWMIFVFSSYTRSGMSVVPPQDPHLNEICAWRWSFHRIHQENPWKSAISMMIDVKKCQRSSSGSITTT